MRLRRKLRRPPPSLSTLYLFLKKRDKLSQHEYDENNKNK
ncbi:hypothetical protein CHCC20331_0926 [Bacillus paralicheniformis]|nr:hypothetical protein CHCC20372_3769 [Bacillus paralicheniformis]TWK46039.1 hypothetical protein CHCC20348_2760 [Bacillus paralicheniformis]TWK85773.1 hypothetical protein CHCC20331_0926 [Bacillus paralicheniformis]